MRLAYTLIVMSRESQNQWPEEHIRLRIADMRQDRGWTQTELARRMAELGFENFNQIMMSRTEKGERPIRSNELVAFARIFNVEIDTLLMPNTEGRIQSWLDHLNDRLRSVALELNSLEMAQHRLALDADRADLDSLYTRDEINSLIRAVTFTPRHVGEAVSQAPSDPCHPFGLSDLDEVTEPNDEAVRRYWELSPAQRSLERAHRQAHKHREERS